MNVINHLKAGSLTLALALGGASVNAIAEDSFNEKVQESQQPMVSEFVKLDVSKNGMLTPREAAKDKLFSKKNFNKADVDHDGTLDQNEYVNYKSTVQKKTAGVVISDSVITTKAKAKILGTKGLKSMQISVETHDGQIILSGLVDNETAKNKAEAVVSKIRGVKSVKNSLEVKS